MSTPPSLPNPGQTAPKGSRTLEHPKAPQTPRTSKASVRPRLAKPHKTDPAKAVRPDPGTKGTVQHQEFQSTAARAQAIAAALAQTYPQAHCELVFTNPLELLVATILSAQCTDKRVNQVTEDLFRRYRTAEDYAHTSQEELEHAIHSTGFYRNKAKNIRAMATDLIHHHHGKVPDDMEALTALAGVGRKTANVVLGNVFGKNEGIVVDTHVARLSHRLGLTQAKAPEKIEEHLMPLIAQSDWTLFSHWLIWHGRRRCMARKPDCGECEIANLCPSAGTA